MNKEEYIFSIAIAVSKRATCPDLKVGCVIATINGHILSTGYNGVIHGAQHCKVKNNKCAENNHKHRVVHSEINCICHAAKWGIPLNGSIAYVTEKCCIKCAAALKQAGVKRIKILRKVLK